jgi:hypothetical protein
MCNGFMDARDLEEERAVDSTELALALPLTLGLTKELTTSKLISFDAWDITPITATISLAVADLALHVVALRAS